MRLTLLTSLILFPLFDIFSQNISGNVPSYPFNLPLEEAAVTLKNNQTGDVLGTDSTDANGNYSIDYVIVGVDDKKNLPTQFYLSSAYPNPFNPETKIDFNAAKQGRYNVKIFSISGELVYSKNYDINVGFHSFVISGLGSAGVYLFYISGEEFSTVQKLLLLDGGSGNVNIELTNSSAALRKVSYDDLKIEFRKPGYADKDTVVSWAMNLVVNASINKLSELRNIELTAFVEMSAVQVPLRYFTAKLKNNAGTVIQTKHSGDTNFVLFTDVSNLNNYTIEAVSDTASRPNFLSIDTTIYLLNDTLIVINPVLYLRPIVLANLENKTVNEDEMPSNPRLHDLYSKAVGYDSLGNQVNPEAINFSIISQSNHTLAPVSIDVNRFTKLDSLLSDGNGTNNVNVKAVAPNGLSVQKGFSVIVQARTDRRGQLKDIYGNARQGYIFFRNGAGQQFILQTDVQGGFAYQMIPSGWDSLKAQIKNDVRPSEGGFIRAMYFTNPSDLNNITVVAVPHLADTTYIGLDTLDSFIKEANFDYPVGNNVGKLKKADLNNLLDFIADSAVVNNGRINPVEQDYIVNIIEQRIDPNFNHPSAKWKVPQDSVMTSTKINAINWFKNKNGALGSISTWDLNNDGILEGANIQLLYIINIIGQDTFYNTSTIVQEGLSGRVAPGEVGITSPIKSDRTVLHKNTPRSTLQPADIWLVKISENYPALTPHDDLLKKGNYAAEYERLYKQK